MNLARSTYYYRPKGRFKDDAALIERIARKATLEKYRGGRARNWYLDREYDLKLTCRAAHKHQGLGPLPPGSGTFRTYDAREHLSALEFPVDYVE